MLAANNVQTLLENISDIEEKIRKLQSRVRAEVENCQNLPQNHASPPLPGNARQAHLAHHANSNRMSDKRPGYLAGNPTLAALDQHQLSPVHAGNSGTNGANLIVPRGRQFNLLHSEGFSLLTSGASANLAQPELGGALTSPHNTLHASALILSNNTNNAASTGPLIEPHLLTSEIKKMDAQFKKLLMNHPEDIVQIIDGQLEMVLLQKNLDHPLATKCLFIATWLTAYERIERPSLAILQQISESFESLFVNTQTEVLKYYPYLKEKKFLASANESIYHILWQKNYQAYMLLVKKHCALDNAKFQALYDAIDINAIAPSDFDLHHNFWLDRKSLEILKEKYDTSQFDASIIDARAPYSRAIEILQKLPSQMTVQRKLKCLEETSTQILSEVTQFWKNFQKEIPVGADEFLPLMSYVVAKAQISTIFSECLFMELLIPNPNGKEGYLLITLQTAIQVVMDILGTRKSRAGSS